MEFMWMEDAWILNFNGVWVNGQDAKCLKNPPRLEKWLLFSLGSQILKNLGSIRVQK